MSAIFGIINKHGQHLEDNAIQQMQHALAHRATNGKYYWRSPNVFFGQYDLNSTSQQTLEQGGIIIATDARIDNRQELAASLNIDPQLALTLNNAQLIIAASQKWGEDCVHHFEGEFAFAIYNIATGTIFCAVDHIGVRPLYYYDTPDAFIFSSEMKGILAVKGTPNTFNEETLIEYFFRQSDQSKTYNSEVFALCGGHTLTLGDSKQLHISKYWTPQPLGKYHFSKDNDWAECLRDLLFKTVAHSLHTDAPVGITLSGGLDSSSIACIAGKILEQKNQPLYAFSSVLPEDYTGFETDERKDIDLVGKHLKNLVQTYVEAPGTGPLSGLQTSFELEETIPNAFFYMDRALQQAMQQKNIRVALSGFGGDLFVSHKGNFVLYQLIAQGKFGKAIDLLKQARSFDSSYLQIIKTDYIAYTAWHKYYTAYKNKGRTNWRIHTPLTETFTAKYLPGIDFAPSKDQGAWMIEYISSGQAGRLLGNFTNSFAAYNMESATPLLNKNIMEFMLDVPMEQFRVGGAKRSILRRAMEGVLPPEIQWRNDKQPYSPDYITRILKEKEAINTLMHTVEDGPVMKFINPSHVADALNSLQPTTGMADGKEIAGIRISQGVIATSFLNWLLQNGYLFK